VADAMKLKRIKSAGHTDKVLLLSLSVHCELEKGVGAMNAASNALAGILGEILLVITLHWF
jgi:hypothetical protein